MKNGWWNADGVIPDDHIAAVWTATDGWIFGGSNKPVFKAWDKVLTAEQVDAEIKRLNQDPTQSIKVLPWA